LPFDLTYVKPQFSSILQEIVGDAGGPGDGFDVLFQTLVDGVDATASIFDILLGDIAALVPGVTDIDPIEQAIPFDAAATADSLIGGDIAALDAHFALIQAPPTPPSGGGSTGTSPCGGNATDYLAQVDFGTVKTVGGTASGHPVKYTYDPNASAPYNVLGVTLKGFAGIAVATITTPLHVTVGKPPVFEFFLDNVTPGDFSATFTIVTDQPGGGGKICLHVTVQKGT
jgi:hypothetical protein